MRDRLKNTTQKIVVQEDEIDLSKASYSPDLSSTAMDEETQTFHVTMDKITFKKPVEIITTVLDANGYALNLENILSCLDELTMGARVKLNQKTAGANCPTARDFMPCIQFQLPTKAKVGPMLQRFYSEIENYETQISRLQKNHVEKRAPKTKSPEQLQKEIEKLKADNTKLKSQVDELSSRLAQAAKFQANANKALASQNIMPPDIKMATVREISMSDRQVLVKSGRTAYQVPLTILYHLPEPGDSCLLHIQDGHVAGAFFYDGAGQRFDTDLAQILFADAKRCKLRKQRQVHILHAKNAAEEEVFRQLKRHQNVILYSVNQVIIRVESLASAVDQKILHSLQEEIILYHLQRQVQEEQNKKTKKESKIKIA
ncbi:MAG: hypothetical protein ACOH5I_20095 [Oligoflexus sp.]